LPCLHTPFPLTFPLTYFIHTITKTTHISSQYLSHNTEPSPSLPLLQPSSDCPNLSFHLLNLPPYCPDISSHSTLPTHLPCSHFCHHTSTKPQPPTAILLYQNYFQPHHTYTRQPHIPCTTTPDSLLSYKQPFTYIPYFPGISIPSYFHSPTFKTLHPQLPLPSSPTQTINTDIQSKPLYHLITLPGSLFKLLNKPSTTILTACPNTFTTPLLYHNNSISQNIPQPISIFTYQLHCPSNTSQTPTVCHQSATFNTLPNCPYIRQQQPALLSPEHPLPPAVSPQCNPSQYILPVHSPAFPIPKIPLPFHHITNTLHTFTAIVSNQQTPTSPYFYLPSTTSASSPSIVFNNQNSSFTSQHRNQDSNTHLDRCLSPNPEPQAFPFEITSFSNIKTHERLLPPIQKLRVFM